MDVVGLDAAASGADIHQLALLRGGEQGVLLAVEGGGGGIGQAEIVPDLRVDFPLQVFYSEAGPAGLLYGAAEMDGHQTLVIAHQADVRAQRGGLEGQLPGQAGQGDDGGVVFGDLTGEQGLAAVLEGHFDLHSLIDLPAGCLPAGNILDFLFFQEFVLVLVVFPLSGEERKDTHIILLLSKLSC